MGQKRRSKVIVSSAAATVQRPICNVRAKATLAPNAPALKYDRALSGDHDGDRREDPSVVEGLRDAGRHCARSADHEELGQAAERETRVGHRRRTARRTEVPPPTRRRARRRSSDVQFVRHCRRCRARAARAARPRCAAASAALRTRAASSGAMPWASSSNSSARRGRRARAHERRVDESELRFVPGRRGGHRRRRARA